MPKFKPAKLILSVSGSFPNPGLGFSCIKNNLNVNKNFLKASLILTVLLYLLSSWLLFHSTQIQAAAPAAGSHVENQAYATYLDTGSGYFSRQYSNIVSMTILAQEALLLENDQTQLQTAGGIAYLAHRLLNTGNAASDIQLSFSNLGGDDFDLQTLTLSQDLNGNGVTDSGEPDIVNGSLINLSPGQSIDLLISGDIPNTALNGQSGQVLLTANTLLQGISVSNTDTVSVVSGAVIQLTNNVSQQSANPGDLLTLNLTATNTGNLAASGINVTVDGSSNTLIVLENPIPANTVFAGIVDADFTTVLYHRAGDPPGSYTTTPPANVSDIDAVAFAISSLASSQSFDVRFDLSINNNASGNINSYGKITYQNGITPTATANTSSIAQILLPNIPPTINFYSDNTYAVNTSRSSAGLPVYVQVDGAQCNIDPSLAETIVITITTLLSGDNETYIATETRLNSGFFTINPDIPTASEQAQPVSLGNGTLEVAENDTLVAQLNGCGSNTVIQNQLLIDPFGVVFDSKTGVPLAGASVTLIDVSGTGNGGNPGGPATVFAADGTTSAPSTVLTGNDGRFEFPLVASSTYRLQVTPAGNYSYPSILPPDLLAPGYTINSSASYGGTFIVSSATGPVKVDLPLDASAFGNLFVEKTASRSRAEVGDFIDYQIKIKNNSTGLLGDVRLKDYLPAGFSYQANSVRLDGDITSEPLGSSGSQLNFYIGSLALGESRTLKYRTRIGPLALNGDGINRAQATSAAPLSQYSNVASTRVYVEPGVFSDRAYLIGKVFMDCNQNRVQNQEELGVPGVRLYLEDGTFVITDAEGKYSLYGLSPRTHVLKVDRTSLPEGAELVVNSNRHAGDAHSRFVDLRKGELHKADFTLGSCHTTLLEAVHKRRAKGEVFVAEVERELKTELNPDSNARNLSDPKSLAAQGLLHQQDEQQLVEAFSNVPSRKISDEKSGGSPSEESIDLEKTLATLNADFDFVNLKDRQVLLHDQSDIIIKGKINSQFKLYLNDKRIHESRVGKRVSTAGNQITAWQFIGIDFRPGNNLLKAILLDPFGNERDQKSIQVTTPGKPAQLILSLPSQTIADGHTPVPVKVTVSDENKVPVGARTPVTLEASLGRWAVHDLNPDEPGIQVFIEGGEALFELLPPQTPGEGDILVSSGPLQSQQSLSFLPHLRPMLAVGVIEGVLNLNKLDKNAFTPARKRDGFEEELRGLSFGNADDEVTGGVRAALFLKGKVKGEYLLTAGYDSDKDTEEKLFRDIQPDRFYPVYGDASIRGFDAQSTGKLYVRIDKSRSYLLYGDFQSQSPHQAKNLGYYNRSLNGLKEHYETDKLRINAFLSQDSTQQVIEELPALGISGPYQLTRDNAVENSERIEIVTRDRRQPGVVLKTENLTRFSDYAFDPFSGSIIFAGPVASLDENLNPVFIRVTYEVEQGGDDFWIAGLDAQYKINQNFEIGGSYVNDRNPLTRNTLSSANATYQFSKNTYLMAEVAQTDSLDQDKGKGQGIELRHEGERLQGKIRMGKTDETFNNPAANLNQGRSEINAKLSYRLSDKTHVNADLIRSENTSTHGHRRGAEVSLVHQINQSLNLEIGSRHSKESAVPADSDTTGLYSPETTTVLTRVSSQLPWLANTAVFGEYEQDLNESDKKIAALGGEYRFSDRGRLYARHELISSLGNPFTLNDSQTRNSTVFGIDTRYMKDTQLFSEYRVRDALSGRDAEAALGLRNAWTLSEGIKLNTSFERIKSLNDKDEAARGNETTAITGALEYTRNPLWKGSARLEWRDAATTESWLNTLGIARKLNRDWVFLGKSSIYQTQGKNNQGDSAKERMQLGLAYRETDFNRWQGLGKYERKNESDQQNQQDIERSVDLISLHLGYQFNRPLLINGRYASKWVRENSNGINSRFANHLLGTRLTYDFRDLWDLGLQASTLFNSDSNLYGLGVEVGRVIQSNLWLSVGYNLFGYRDDELTDMDYTEPGVYVRLRFKFDENLFRGSDPQVNNSLENNSQKQ